MKVIYTIVFGLIIFPFSLFAQQKPEVYPVLPELPEMSSYDSLKLSQIAELKLSGEVTRRMLPPSLNNSKNPWYRPTFGQVGLECGQASSIGYVFTYELDYLRNAPANIPTNQYATHFSYNFVNGGTDAGVSYYDTYEILKYAGNPTVDAYGGMAAGGPSRWMSGYDLYYEAMQNRLTDLYSIKLNTIEGIQTLKNWLYDHGDGSSHGGLACFYAQYVSPTTVLPEGTPQAGMSVIPSWGSSANHSMTIVGYNDSICWDYNNDGLYTNDIDLNLDGQIDVRDWEVGGLIICNTYGGYYNWGNEGFAFITYKSVADAYQQGGIWNNTANVIKVKDNYLPQLTAKISLTYSCRNNLRVMMGVSSNPMATQPDYILHYPIFDFQGGCNPMQSTVGPATIEFGLDLNYLLGYLTSGQEARYFLMIQEDDPLGSQAGSLGSFALIDYTNGASVINSNISELPLVNDNITYATVNASVNFTPVEITTDSLPPAQLYSNYSYQLQASSGVPPYRWSIADSYERIDSTSQMVEIDGIKLQPTSNSSGKAKVTLPFEFPFYGNKYQTIYATSDGTLMFEDDNIPWPFYSEARTYFIENKMIAACLSHPFVIGSSTEGIWYEEAEDYVIFRWKLSVYQITGTIFNATVKLFSDGKVEINYGEFIVPYYTERCAGVSAGDGENYELFSYDPDFVPVNNQWTTLIPVTSHSGISLSEDGILAGTFNEVLDSIPVTICVTDKYNFKTYKTFYLRTEGLLMDFEIEAQGDNIVEFGEDVFISLHIKNLNSFAIGPTNLNLNTMDPYFTKIDMQETFTGLAPGDTMTIQNAFHLLAHNNVPDNHLSQFILNAGSNEGNWSRLVLFKAYRAVTSIAGINIVDGNNGMLEPGETVLLGVNIENTGGAELTNALATISSSNPYVSIYLSTANRDTLSAGDQWSIMFGVVLSPEAPLNQIVEFQLSITGDHEFNSLKTIPIYTGLLVEDFESGDFLMYDWFTGGHAPWITEQGSAFEGEWCARSGVIDHNQNSTLALEWDVAYPDSISFRYKVVSENNYDFLRFFSNQTELAKWSGNIPWKKATIGVSAGFNLFSWKYTKDYSVSTGDDCAWLDYIILPVYSVPTSTSSLMDVNARLSVYPNPGNDYFNISYSLEKPSQAEILITDMHGRVLFYQKFDKDGSLQNQVTADGIITVAGVYAVILKTEWGILVKKIIKTFN